ncbi:MAG: hypothetical protein ACRDHL_13005 [Candidatus Promineifilaceae bacterium]
MTFSAVLALFGGGALLFYLLFRSRPNQAMAAVAAVLALASLVWLLAGRGLIGAAAAGPLGPASASSLWRWRLDAAAWLLTLAVWLLTLAASLRGLRGAANGRHSAASAFLLPACAAACLALWAANWAGVIWGWTLLAAVLLAYERQAAPGFLGAGGGWRAAALLLGAPLLLWLAVVIGGQALTEQIDLAALGGPAGAWAVLAAAAWLVAPPLLAWRPGRTAPTGLALGALPIAPAGLLLARMAEGGFTAGPLLLASALGLLSLVWGVNRAWALVGRRTGSLGALALAQAGLVLLSSAWANGAAALAEGQSAVLGVGGLMLIAAGAEQGRATRVLGLLLALAAMGAPLAAGFLGRTGLTSALAAEGQFFLLVVVLALEIALAAALWTWALGQAADGRQNDAPAGMAQRILALAGAAMPLLGLLAWPLPLEALNLPAAGLTLLTILAGFALSQSLGPMGEAQDALRRALRLRLPLERLTRWALRGRSFTLGAVREAAAIMEGEGGMLWLLVSIILFLLLLQG